MTPTEHELGPYIREVSVITDTWQSEATSYAKYRAIGEGFTGNVGWLKDTAPPTISFFNGLTAMLDLSVVVSVWKMTEPRHAKEEFSLPGELFSSSPSARRRKHDEIRSLPRLSFLFRKAFGGDEHGYRLRYAQRQQEIVQRYNLPQRDMADYTEKCDGDRLYLLDLCDRADGLSTSAMRTTLDIVRNQGFAHSSAISRKIIAAGMEVEGLDFTRTMLFSFGDEVMQLARDFDAVWHQRSNPSIKDLIAASVETGKQFWSGAEKGLRLD